MKKHILIVDDEELILSSMKIIIEDFNREFEVSVANSGGKALELMNLSNVDLLITDINMPDIDGLSLIMEIQKRHDPIKVIAMSGAGGVYLRAADSFGASYVLKKPIREDDLKSVINKALN